MWSIEFAFFDFLAFFGIYESVHSYFRTCLLVGEYDCISYNTQKCVNSCFRSSFQEP